MIQPSSAWLVVATAALVVRKLDEALPSGQDNRALFQIANNYFIRHWNEKQLADCDSLWLTWIFNLFESTFYTWLGFVIRSRGTRP